MPSPSFSRCVSLVLKVLSQHVHCSALPQANGCLQRSVFPTCELYTRVWHSHTHALPTSPRCPPTTTLLAGVVACVPRAPAGMAWGTALPLLYSLLLLYVLARRTNLALLSVYVFPVFSPTGLKSCCACAVYDWRWCRVCGYRSNEGRERRIEGKG